AHRIENNNVNKERRKGVEKSTDEILGAFLLIKDYRILTNEELEDVQNAILELQDKTRKYEKNKKKIDSCIKFIDNLLPKYLEEKSHIICGDDWELNKSIYVMDELRGRLMGYIKND
ncbi:MAG: hypothetical protein IJX78_00695, partial [Bacilli bacterium]|nr:hypothetical protein [Bacilli bacterium]